MEKGFFIPGHVQKGYHPCQTETRRNHCSDRARPLARVLACESFVGIFVNGPIPRKGGTEAFVMVSHAREKRHGEGLFFLG
jgi:hypothetical protein